MSALLACLLLPTLADDAAAEESTADAAPTLAEQIAADKAADEAAKNPPAESDEDDEPARKRRPLTFAQFAAQLNAVRVRPPRRATSAQMKEAYLTLVDKTAEAIDGTFVRFDYAIESVEWKDGYATITPKPINRGRGLNKTQYIIHWKDPFVLKMTQDEALQLRRGDRFTMTGTLGTSEMPRPYSQNLFEDPVPTKHLHFMLNPRIPRYYGTRLVYVGSDDVELEFARSR